MWKITRCKNILAIISLFLILIVGSGTGAAAEIIVHNGESIQGVVDNATPGDTIIVSPGTYDGNITLNKGDLVIRSQSNNPDDTIIQGNGFYLASDAQGITIKGLTLKGMGTSYGISLEQYADCTIENNKIVNYNTAIDTNMYSSFNINNNEISSCGSGVAVGECYDAIVNSNTILNCGTGVVVEDLGDAQIENNIITKNDDGIALMYGARATISGNTVSYNKKYGLYDNAYGGSTIYNNYFNNTKDVFFGEDHVPSNTWNTAKTTGKNIIGGSYTGGNYWAQPDGAGFSQTHSDADGDGIADEAVSFNENEIDHAALVSSSSITPVQSAESVIDNLTETQKDSVIDNLTVNQTELVTDNLTANQTGSVTDTQNETQTGSVADNLTANQTESVTDTQNETQTEVSTEETEDTEDSSSGSSSSGSSSSGSSHHSSGSSGSLSVSPEPQENVAAKDTAKVFVYGGKTVYFNFTNNVTVVDYISFESEKTVGEVTAIAENLKNKSDLVTELPNGSVYRSFNVWVGNGDFGDSDSIKNAVLGFKVGKDWIKENNINQSSIVLYKYNDEKKEWVKLPVNLVSEDDQFLHFTANVPGYSSFVIIGEHGTISTETNQTVVSINESNNTSKPAAKDTKLPGFGIIMGIFCLICAVKRKRK